MRAVAAEGIRTICYNVMPVVDWTRTDLDFPLPTGATALRFDHDRFAAFDLHVLKRKNAEADYDAATRARARKVSDGLSQGEIETLTRNISAGLPGATTFSANLDAFRDRIASYGGITPDKMRANVVAFLAEVTPVAEQLGVRLTLASGRSAAPDVRPAAHRLDRGRLRGAVRRGAVAGERHLLLRRQPWGAPGQRRGGDGEGVRRRASISRICARR